MRIILAVILSFSCMAGDPDLTTPVSLLAGQSSPIRWAAGMVTYQFSSNVPENGKMAFRTAFETWSNAVDGVIWFKEDPAGVIVVSWDDGSTFGGSSYVGVTTVKLAGPLLKGANIIVNGKFGDYLSYDKATLGLALHEIGHAIGLGHAKTDVIYKPQHYPTMYPILSYDANTLEEEDIRAARNLYLTDDIIGSSLTDLANLKLALSSAGIAFVLSGPAVASRPREVRGSMVQVLTMGKDKLFFDVDGRYVGASSGGRFYARK